MTCDSNGYFNLKNCSYRSKEDEKKLKSINFYSIETSYEYPEIVSYDRKNNRYKVKVWYSQRSNEQARDLWLEAGPPLRFSNYLERIIKNVNGFFEIGTNDCFYLLTIISI